MPYSKNSTSFTILKYKHNYIDINLIIFLWIAYNNILPALSSLSLSFCNPQQQPFISYCWSSACPSPAIHPAMSFASQTKQEHTRTAAAFVTHSSYFTQATELNALFMSKNITQCNAILQFIAISVLIQFTAVCGNGLLYLSIHSSLPQRLLSGVHL